VLSLVVVPSFYMIMDDFSRLLSYVFKGLIGEKEEEVLPEGNDVLAERIALLAAEQADLRDKLSEATTPRLRPGMAAE
jgi:hypothetical protein